MISLNLDITKECNLRCLYCGAGGDCDKGSGGHNKEIDSHEIRSLLVMAMEAGCRILTIAGGEPLLRRDLPEILRYASGLGYNIGLLTNGTLITDEVASELSKSGVVYVRVSMESADKDRFEEYRGKNTFEKVKRALYNLKKHAVCVGIGATIYPGNISEIDNLIDFCLAHQVDFIRVAPGLRIGLAKDQLLGFSHYLNIIDKLQSVLTKKFINSMSSFELIPENLYEHLKCACPGGRYTYYLTPAGEVKMCPFINNGFDLERFEAQNISEDNKFKAMRTSMEQFMNYLPQAIRGKCATCELKCTCRGGCLATKLHNGLSIYDEQTLCVKEMLSKIVSRNIGEEDFRKVVAHWLSGLAIFKNRGIPLCIRQLPFWTIDLSQYSRLG